ncbi:hypothetical protein M8J76_012992 [Diaphorina citri]|nr:hypothetical protein M8J75_010263 [Diaphorina citri]KAI5719652.1 hypothetical protein M8J76_012992 [Diaphorina citri]
MLPPDSPVVKQLSETRWSARAEAVTALARSYHHIRNALQNLANDINQKPETKQKATGLININGQIRNLSDDRYLEKYIRKSQCSKSLPPIK